MIRVRSQIKSRQDQLANHPFFGRLSGQAGPTETMGFAGAATFFVMAFQDILRLNSTKIRDPELLKIAKLHRREDGGHDDWFLHDLVIIEGAVPDVRWLFGPLHENTRDVAYELVSEVFHLTDDRTRIVLVLVLEAGGHIMFRRMADYLDRVDYGQDLRYFSRRHLDVELDHGLFEAQANASIDAIALPPAAYAEATDLVDRAFAALGRLLDGFEQRILDRHAGTVVIPVRPAS